MPLKKHFDTIVIGGGFFGCRLAEKLAREGQSVLLLERMAGLMQRASALNQARVHQGYHYPRSFLTAVRSKVNFKRFVDEFPRCVDDKVEAVYAVANLHSKVNALQFSKFMCRINVPLSIAPKRIQDFFNPGMVEQVYMAEEFVFNVTLLRNEMLNRLHDAGVTIKTHATAREVKEVTKNILSVVLDDETLIATTVFNCTYSNLNTLLNESGHLMLPLRHELTEMALVEVPFEFLGLSFTIMCGPFFSLMPYPSKNCYTLSHVRFTPHASWKSTDNNKSPYDILGSYRKESKGLLMKKDAARFIPAIDACQQIGSIWEVKTIVTQSDINDSRPILLVKHQGVKGLHCVLGGKIDNVYDVEAELDLQKEIAA